MFVIKHRKGLREGFVVVLLLGKVGINTKRLGEVGMKRGKDDEKVMGPLFPRLRVSDTEKGGPRAPPRNKMALYEQFSIPSQIFNPGLLPPHPSTSTNTVPPASSSQVTFGFCNFGFPFFPHYHDYDFV